ncbi:MAG: polysaccharide biosynthesis tyrosine autokinase [Firmicutes bacterium]|nr:polysaccharide biosynthesis tyrosine autokinase [Bacillota bacterium]
MEKLELREFIYILLKGKWIIILITILAILISGLISYFLIEPEYKTFTTLMVGKLKDYDTKDIEYQDILINQKLVSTYGEIAKSRLVSREVINNLNLNMTYEEIKKKVEVSLVKDTEIIKINVTDTNPFLATKIANETAKVFKESVTKIIQIENIQIIDKALVPSNPISPKPLFNMSISAVLGIMVSILIVFLLEYFDNTLKTPEDVEKYLSIPILGMIPLIENVCREDRKIIVYENPKSPVSEAYRTLRTNIKFSNIDKKIKVIVITSPSSGEGKSTTAVNLATTMAQNGKKVLLIDSDLRKPTIHKHFKISNDKGLISCLLEDIDYERIIFSTVISGFDVLTSGRVPPNPSELMDSKKMRGFINSVKKEYDLVIIDTPPVGMVTDATVLSTVTDGVLLVFETGETIIKVSQNAKNLLDKVKANVLGVVLNKIPVKEGYYKYYYNNYYYQED